MRFALTLAAALPLALPAAADPRAAAPDRVTLAESSAGPLAVRRVMEGLEEPWAVGFLPDGGILVTERDGRLWLMPPAGAPRAVEGVPEVAADGQGGLLDLLVPRDFAQSREILLSFARPQRRGVNTAIAIARLSADGGRLEDVRVIFEAAEGFSGGRHFGGRLAEGPDGLIYLSLGDRGEDDSAQDRANHNGSIIRIARDGTVPPGNPFSGQAGMRPEIWSFGHRNPQGLAFAPDGTLWAHEHGARGGDEVNRVAPGLNYGWPVIAYGRHYWGLRIGIGTEAPGMEQPLHHWDPSIAPSGLAVVTGGTFPDWEGDLLAGALQGEFIVRLDPEAGFAEERIASPEFARARDVRIGPDGAIWVLSVIEGTLLRVTPAR